MGAYPNHDSDWQIWRKQYRHRADTDRTGDSSSARSHLATGVAHLYDLGFPVFLTAIARTLSLSTFQAGILLGIRTSGSGLVSMGAGVLVDRFRNEWGIMLTACMVLNVIAFVVIGLSPNWALLIFGVCLDFRSRLLMASARHSVLVTPVHRPARLRHINPQLRLHGRERLGAAGGRTAAVLLVVRNVLFLYAIPARW